MRCLASASNACNSATSASNSRSGTMLGPSEGAWSGSGWVSMNTPATPTATAARASTGTNSRCPPEAPPSPPGCCTEWVASKITGAPVFAQDRQRSHVGDQRVVAEAGAALGDQHIASARLGQLGDDVLHVPRREKLPLLDVHRPPRARGGDQQVGLAAEERRNLQHVDRLRGGGALLALVHVGQHRQAEALADFGEDRQRRREPDPALRPAAGPVGLVERGLEHEADVAPLRDLLQRASRPPARARGFRAGRGRRSGRAADRRRRTTERPMRTWALGAGMGRPG